jgi:carbamoyltransferase
MEFGDRALGNRSILADPRHAKTKDKINSMIKYREPYRPFAPVVPAEEAATYFQVEAGFACPYMEKVVPIREAYREELGAVTHVDGSGRVQTVAKEDNPLFYRLLREFEALTGVPIVLNTSFNINGEPIVLSPDDAITTFFNSGLEVLIMGSYVLVKTN